MADFEESAYDQLPKKHQRLVDEYLRNGMVQWKAYFSVIWSGDKENPNLDSVRANASRFFSDDNIQAAIEQRLAQETMSANEVLHRLTEQARNVQMQYLEPGGSIDLESLIEQGRAHLVKGIKYAGKDADRVVVEFHDVQAALKLIGQTYKMFSERHEIDFSGDLRVERIEIVVSPKPPDAP